MTEHDSVDTDSGSKTANKEPSPPEVVMGWWSLITQHSNGIMAVTTIAIFLSGLGYTVFAGLQWCANKKAADAAYNASVTASRQLEMVDRPWIKESVKSGAKFQSDKNGNITWAINIQGVNVGHSVATGMFVQGKLIAMRGADYVDGPSAQLKEYCDGLAKTKIRSAENWGVSVFPGDHADLPFGINGWEKDIKPAIIDGGQKLGPSIFLMFIGCIDYEYPTSNFRHQTRFIYDVFHKDPTSGENDPFLSLEKTFPSEEMVLWPHRVSGQFAY